MERLDREIGSDASDVYLNASHRRRHHQEDPHGRLEEVVLITIGRFLQSGLGYARAIVSGLAAHLAPYAAD